ncbi:hypothetical protein [Crossiella sp. CA198]|uniref:hypothetical protein n=1 Tax=Crossiella sp. CA198 TaxID=3455607 RepID=UPI003F8D7844
MRTLTRLGVGVAALVTAFSLAACGGEDKGDGPASLNGGNGKGNEQKAGDEAPKDPKEAMLKFAKCMRDNGIDMPDPDPNSGGIAAQRMDETNMEKFEKANKACEKFAPKSNYNPNDPAEKDKRAKQNKCLRENGLDIKESGEGQGGMITLDGDKEKIEKAMKACGMGMAGSAPAK